MSNEEKILEMLAELKDALAEHDRKNDEQFQAIDAKMSKTFSEQANTMAHITEVVDKHFASLADKVDDNTTAIMKLAYNQLIGKAQ